MHSARAWRKRRAAGPESKIPGSPTARSLPFECKREPGARSASGAVGQGGYATVPEPATGVRLRASRKEAKPHGQRRRQLSPIQGVPAVLRVAVADLIARCNPRNRLWSELRTGPLLQVLPRPCPWTATRCPRFRGENASAVAKSAAAARQPYPDRTFPGKRGPRGGVASHSSVQPSQGVQRSLKRSARDTCEPAHRFGIIHIDRRPVAQFTRVPAQVRKNSSSQWCGLREHRAAGKGVDRQVGGRIGRPEIGRRDMR
jgi:hypothetical protein